MTRTAVASLLLALPLAVVAAPLPAAGMAATLPDAGVSATLPAAGVSATLPAAGVSGILPALGDPDFTPMPEDQAPGPEETGGTGTEEPEDATGGTPLGAADQITFGIAPAGEEGADGRTSFRLELEPGATHTDHVEVTNYSDRPVTFALLASDGTVTAGGTFDLLPSAVAPVGTGAWIEIDGELDLEPEASAVVPFTLTVPDDAVPGDHPGGVVASVSSVGEDEAGNVALDTRAGARIHLRVAGDLMPSLGVQDVRAEYRPSWNPFAPGTVDVSWDVVNDGNVRLGAEQAAEVTGLLGLGGGQAVIEGPREVLPGQSAAQSATIEAWPVFRLTGGVSALPVVVGSDEVAEELLSGASSGSVAMWAVPWTQLALLVLVVGLVVLLVLRRRRGRARLAAALSAAREEGARSGAEARGREVAGSRG